MQKPLHILFLSAWFPNRVAPFAGDFVQRHAKLVSATHQVTVVFAKADAAVRQVEMVEHIEGNYREIIFYYPPSNFRLFNLLKKISCIVKGAKLAGKYDLIHANITDYYLLWVFAQKWFRGIPFVLSEHWSGYYHKLPVVKKQIAKLACSAADFVFPVSDNLKQAMQSHGLRANYHVVPNVVDTVLFQPVEHQNVRPSFFHASMLNDEVKNITGMLRTAKKLHEQGYEFTFQIGGNGENEFIKQFIEDNQLQEIVQTFGSLSHEQVAEKMRHTDCFVLFSNYETQSIVCLEAFACGVPVIATKVGGVPENFKGNYGLLIEKGNEEQLANAMIAIINGQTFDDKLDMHQQIKESYSAEHLAEVFSRFYEQVVD